MGFEADGHREEDHAYIYPIPRTIRSKGRRLRSVMDGHRIAPVSPFMGSIFDWKATLHFSDLGAVDTIEARREEVRGQIRAQVEQAIIKKANGGAALPHDLDDDGNVGSTIYGDEIHGEGEVDRSRGRVAITQQVNMKVHLWHQQGQDPKAALGKAVDHITDGVLNLLYEGIGRAEEEAEF